MLKNQAINLQTNQKRGYRVSLCSNPCLASDLDCVSLCLLSTGVQVCHHAQLMFYFICGVCACALLHAFVSAHV